MASNINVKPEKSDLTSKRVLIIGPSWVGDMIMAQSLFKQLQNNDPGVQITVLAPSWTFALLARMPQVHKTITMPIGHGRLALNHRWKLAQQIKAQGFDQAIVLPGSLKSALIPLFARIKTRTGYLGEQRYGLLNDIHKLDKQLLATTVERFVALSGDVLALADCPQPALVVEQSAALASADRFNFSNGIPLLIICPGAEYGPAKRWPIEHFAKLAIHYAAKGRQVWLMGSVKDQPVCQQINQLSGHVCVNLSGQTSLQQAIDLISLADAVVSNDSGLMHLSAALGRPLVSIYGSSSPLMTPPLTENAEILWLQLECGPCFERECPLEHLNCLNQISPDRVIQALDKLEV